MGESEHAARSGVLSSSPPEPQKTQARWVGWAGKGLNLTAGLLLVYFAFVGKAFMGILWPQYPDVDPASGRQIPKYENLVLPGDDLSAKIWVGTKPFPSKKEPVAEFLFKYDWESFEAVNQVINVSVPEAHLQKGQNTFLSVELIHARSGRSMRAKGPLVKEMKKPDEKPKFHLLSGDVCPVQPEPAFGKRENYIARGIPKMQVRLVHDETKYPYWIFQGPYLPPLFVDEFWMTNDQLVKLNISGINNFTSEIAFGLMSSARWHFQQHMEQSLSMYSKMLGEDSQEMLEMRDLFANTNPYLLTVTMVVSMLHMVFDVLALKSDVEFFNGCDPEMLNKYVSVKSILVGIFMQVILVFYLWEESANFIVLGFSVLAIFVDIWKVQRAMELRWTKIFGVPVPMMASKVHIEENEDFDTIAMKWLALMITPFILGYAGYTLLYDCYRSWYSYLLTFAASCVYSLGFVLMTPQVFINYKMKSVAYLPWRKFVYRAINTFIDDLFAMIITMPTMHRLSCFRDDIVFFVYLYQLYLYPVDMSRTFDDDIPAEATKQGEQNSGKAAGGKDAAKKGTPPEASEGQEKKKPEPKKTI